MIAPAARRRPPARRLAHRCLGTTGFTIVEVMMAVAIMAFSITTSITTMQRGFMTLDSARNISLSAQIMQSEMEKMRLQPWTTISDSTVYAAGPTTLTIDSVFTSNTVVGSRFTLTRTTSTPQTDVRQITLTVTWTSVDGRPMSRSYSTYYGRYGLYDYFYNSV